MPEGLWYRIYDENGSFLGRIFQYRGRKPDSVINFWSDAEGKKEFLRGTVKSQKICLDTVYMIVTEVEKIVREKNTSGLN